MDCRGCGGMDLPQAFPTGKLRRLHFSAADRAYIFFYSDPGCAAGAPAVSAIPGTRAGVPGVFAALRLEAARDDRSPRFTRLDGTDLSARGGMGRSGRALVRHSG